MSRRENLWGWGLGAVALALAASRKRPGGAGVSVPPGPWVTGGPTALVTTRTEADGRILTTQGETSSRPVLGAAKAAALATAVGRYGDIVDELSARYRVPSAWIFAIHAAEGFPGPTTQGASGDFGLMQIIPANWGGRSAEEMADPKTNFEVATQMLARLRAGKPGGNELPAVASMYNAGSPDGIGPWPAVQSRPEFRSNYGYRSAPGYIDRAIAANNSYLALQGVPNA